ncbi:hypothetical protein DQW50_07050 [Halorubrum sp. 48-1-W]|uniref:hypothetical protein n=1 Tax=Halorubrum sp. 48-1-W TaxID=2249761 RepID=UPI000DCEAD8D|nr:hypothetical protein [Halorubrum sp. 48-1-W]RAW45765.1 hypothetical protein DQW50_07050 [Halorubrum sp. 48-1-W]
MRPPRRRDETLSTAEIGERFPTYDLPDDKFCSVGGETFADLATTDETAIPIGTFRFEVGCEGSTRYRPIDRRSADAVRARSTLRRYRSCSLNAPPFVPDGRGFITVCDPTVQ